MARRMTILAVSIAAGIAALLAFQYQEQEKEIPETITFSTSRGEVSFPHKAHHDLEYACKTCHHHLENDMDVPDQKCRDCHTPDSEVTNQDAFHKSCRDCHREHKKENEDSEAPTSCSACHVKS